MLRPPPDVMVLVIVSDWARNCTWRTPPDWSAPPEAGGTTSGSSSSLDALLAQLAIQRDQLERERLALVTAGETLKQSRLAAIEALSGAITADAMRAMNAAVDGAGRRPADVAREFLSRRGMPGATPVPPPR